ncbi:MAG: prepilin-type N-terminal cleavage/methylation domain-containing protein [Desulfobacterales bacterium]|nr:prepilin-type N-terminal cleavage/methylation domain-containing protein [Desulfobacterales bacterium]
MKYNSNGFTLIEILVVMVIIAMASTLVYVNIAKSTHQKQVQLFAEKMASFSKKARQLALVHGKPIGVYISSDERKCWIGDGSEKLFQSMPIPEDVQIDSDTISEVDTNIFAIQFFPDGSSSGGDLSFLANQVTFYQFSVDLLTGLVMVNQEDRAE